MDVGLPYILPSACSSSSYGEDKMKVYITIFTTECGLSVSNDKVFLSKKAAKDYCKRWKAALDDAFENGSLKEFVSTFCFERKTYRIIDSDASMEFQEMMVEQ
jgi:hypothetical protein